MNHLLSLTFLLKKIAGVILGNGSTTCHAVIIAKARAIPTVAGLGDKIKDIPDNAEVILNGETGEIFVEPTEDLIASYQVKLEEQRRLKRTLCSAFQTSYSD